jgi:protein-histidine pros-kinase
MIITDQHGRIITINAQAERLLGYGRAELAGQPIDVLVPDRLRAAHAEYRQQCATAPRPMGAGFELLGRHKDGHEVAVDISLSSVDTEDGGVIIAAVRDVTEQRGLRDRLDEQHRELETQCSQLRELGRLKSDFLASMSHELRTPLNGIIGFAEIIHDGKAGPLTADQHEFLGDILTSAEHLGRLVGDVLDLARLDAGRMEFHPQAVEPARLVEQVYALVRVLALRGRVTLHTEVDPCLGQVVIDPAAFKQVLYQYLANALNSSPAGGRVDVRLTREGATEFRLEVEDRGPGLREEELDRVFSEVRQLDPETAKRRQGGGLGLALTRRIAEAQGGRVGVRSRPGAGAILFAVLPRVSEAMTEW